MTFMMLPYLLRGLFLMWLVLNQILLFYNFFCYVQIGNTKSNGRCILLNAFNFCTFQMLSRKHLGLKSLPFSLPWQIVVLLLFLFTILAVGEQIRIRSFGKSHVSANSIKEAMDALSMGLCYHLSGGLPLLINERMDAIALRLTGESLLNAEEFWRKLVDGGVTSIGVEALQTGERPIYRFPNGEVIGFGRNELKLKEGNVFEITATDLTREHELTRELQKKQRQAKVINARLKSLLGTIEYVTMSRELLQLKVALHDNVGQILLMAKRYLICPGEVDQSALLELWRTNVRHLIGEAPEPWQIPYYVIGREADQLGIRLEIVGELPEEEALQPVVDQAISAHVINVLQHAEGTVATVRILEGEREYCLTFQNDGNPPEGEIRETGGLANLRKKVEEVGGSMEVSSRPRFEMRLTLPKKTGRSREAGARL